MSAHLVTDELKKKLELKLWDIANELRGKMGADEFRDYILGFMFFNYLSERMRRYADKILEADGINYRSIDETTGEGRRMLGAVREETVAQPGYFLKPSELLIEIASRGAKPGEFILDDLAKILNAIERSTMGTESEDDFDHLFEVWTLIPPSWAGRLKRAMS